MIISGGIMEVKDLKFDKRNYRRHSEKNQSLIKKSINEVGFGRSIVIDAEDEIICGNGVVSQVDKKTPVKVIETDGSELIVVKRTDLKTEDAKRKQLAVMDNSTSDSSDFDLDLLQEDFDADLLGDWGIDIKEEIKKASEKPDVEFATELLEEHNYIVLYFDNKMDWNQCRELLGDLLTTVESKSPKCTLKKRGLGRVLKGEDVINKLQGIDL